MKKLWGMIAVAAAVFLATGCSLESTEEFPKVEIQPYEKAVYETIVIEPQDVSREISVSLFSENAKRVVYHPSYDDMTIKQINVSVGEVVQEGQVLVNFDSEESREKLKEVEEQTAELLVEKEYLASLLAVKEDETVANQLAQINRKLDTYDLKKRELQEEIKAAGITAEQYGMVQTIGRVKVGELVSKSMAVVSVAYGDGIFVGRTTVEYPFEIGQKFVSDSGAAQYTMRLIEIENEGEEKILTFQTEMTAEKYCPWNTLSLILHLEELKQVYAVPRSALKENLGGHFVYVLDEQGYRDHRSVTVGYQDEKCCVILEGLEEGEVVVVR